MATSATRVRLPSINELTSSNSINLSPRFKESKEVPSIGGYKYPIKPTNSNYIFSNPHQYQKPVAPVTPVTPAYEHKQSPTLNNTPQTMHQIPNQPHQHAHHQPPPAHMQQIPPPPPPPAQQHYIPPTPPSSHQQQPLLRTPQPSQQPQQSYHSPPSHFQSPPQYPQYHAPAFIQQVPTQHRHQTYYQPIYYQHAPVATGSQFAVPEVINKPNNKCHRCGTTETPEWRRGPNGVRTLCNACGLFHAKLVKRKGAALAAEEVLNNKVCKGKNGRRISIKKHNSELLKNEMKMPIHHQGLPPIMGQGFPQFSMPPTMIRP